MAVRELTAGLWREAFEASMAARKGLPGYVIQAKESLSEPPLDRGFVDDCRSAFANLSRLVGHGGVIAVVSPHRAEGRSAVAAGMGLAVAHDLESRVLLVDLEPDLRRVVVPFGAVVDGDDEALGVGEAYALFHEHR